VVIHPLHSATPAGVTQQGDRGRALGLSLGPRSHLYKVGPWACLLNVAAAAGEGVIIHPLHPTTPAGETQLGDRGGVLGLPLPIKSDSRQ